MCRDETWAALDGTDEERDKESRIGRALTRGAAGGLPKLGEDEAKAGAGVRFIGADAELDEDKSGRSSGEEVRSPAGVGIRGAGDVLSGLEWI